MTVYYLCIRNSAKITQFHTVSGINTLLRSTLRSAPKMGLD